MSSMVDPSVVLPSFQQAMELGTIQIYPCTLDKTLFHVFDLADGVPRMTYVRLSEEKQVMALIQFFNAEPYDGVPCFDAGWAVPSNFRGKGRAGDTFLSAIRELQNSFFSSKRGETFYVEAIVGTDNMASLKTAEKVFACSGTPGVDTYSGCPIMQFVRRINETTIL